MHQSLNIAFFGSSLVSAYWNGAATYYRGIIRALHERGHRITFYEPDAYGRQEHRDIPDPEWARVVVYPGGSQDSALAALDRARGADVIIKASGVGVFDEFLEAAVLDMKRPGNTIVFWDVDAPATLERVQADPMDPFAALISRYDLILTYGGGDPVVKAYKALGARKCVPVYNALDPSTHHCVSPDSRFAAGLAFLGNRLPDREARVEEFFLRPASMLVDQGFLLGGSGWADKPLPGNVNYVGHVYTSDHNAFNCTPLAVLNIARDSMARCGFSPATRVFEAAGAGACIITDQWTGIDTFLEPGKEILVASSGDEVVEHLRSLTTERARSIGRAAMDRVLAGHTYAHRAQLVEELLFEEKSIEDGSVIIGESTGIINLSENPAPRPLSIVILGLSITSSWGNGHATTYRGLVRGLAKRGHNVLFLEREVPWYAAHRDLAECVYCRTELYTSLEELKGRFAREVREADLVIVGSFVLQGVEVGEWVTSIAQGVTAFYDIDTPVTLAKIEQGDMEYLSPELIPLFNLYLSFTGGPVLERLVDHYGSPAAKPLYCSVDPDVYYPEEQELTWDLGYLGTYSPDRQPALDALLLDPARRWNDGRFIIAGPQYPSGISWPSNVRHVDHIPPDRHRSFYNAQKFTMNITRVNMIRTGYCPSVRLFEAAACATPIISDSWEGLDTFFAPGEDILISQSREETLYYLREMTEEARRAIGAGARRRVLASHTSDIRATELESFALEVLHGPGPSAPAPRPA